MSDAKTCTICKTEKPLDEFHRQPKGRMGRHSQCRTCFNQRHVRKKYDTGTRRRWNLSVRYGITEDQFTEMMKAQEGLCAICKTRPKLPRVDHDHNTGATRGILCHACNVKLAAIEDAEFLKAAHDYLARWT